MLRIVAEVGADAVTHRRVAEVADLPLASTTYCFESKEHLLTAALELAAERDIARLHEFSAMRRSAPADPLELAVAAMLDPIDETWAGQPRLDARHVRAAARGRAAAAAAGGDPRWTDAYLEALGRCSRRPARPPPRPTPSFCSRPPTAC